MMEEKIRAFLGKSINSKKVFVIGCPRSGTNFLGKILSSHPDIVATVENPFIFELSTMIASRPQLKRYLLPLQSTIYRGLHAYYQPKNYADKSHSNLWSAVELSKKFDDAIFIAIWRNPYAVVASMLKHKGVLSRYRGRWKGLKLPNKFLGIMGEYQHNFRKLPLESKCALRWKSHFEKMRQLENVLKDKLLILKYKNLVLETKSELGRIQTFIKLKESFPTQKVKRNPLVKWKRNINGIVKENIDEIISNVSWQHYE